LKLNDILSGAALETTAVKVVTGWSRIGWIPLGTPAGLVHMSISGGLGAYLRIFLKCFEMTK